MSKKPSASKINDYIHMGGLHNRWKRRRTPLLGRRVGERVYNPASFMEGTVVHEIDHLFVRVEWDIIDGPEAHQVNTIWFVWDTTPDPEEMSLYEVDVSTPRGLKKYLKLLKEMQEAKAREE